MKTLAVLDQQRNQNQYFSRSNYHFSDSFGCCRLFHSKLGILPSPLKSFNGSYDTDAYSPPKTPPKGTPIVNSDNNPVSCKSTALSKCRSLKEEFSCSDLWAGPAYCNSPPPSSLPIPMFSLRQKQSRSLEMPATSYDTTLHPIAQSAPPSPGRKSLPSSSNFCLNAFSSISATKDLRRILRLDMDEK